MGWTARAMAVRVSAHLSVVRVAERSLKFAIALKLRRVEAIRTAMINKLPRRITQERGKRA